MLQKYQYIEASKITEKPDCQLTNVISCEFSKDKLLQQWDGRQPAWMAKFT